MHPIARLALGTICAVLAPPAAAEIRSLAEIRESGVLRVCVPTANPPDGEVTPEGCTGACGYGGILGELAGTFARSLGVEAEYWVSSWDGIFHNADGETVKDADYTPASLATGRCDMVGAIMVSLPWRERKMDMQCFLPSRMMIVTRKEALGEITRLEDLAGRTVAVERSMSLHSWVEDQNAGPFAGDPIEIDFRDYADTIPAVDRGEVDFTVVSVLDALYQTRNLVDGSAAAFAVGPLDEGCWGHLKGDAEMGAEMRAFFDGQTADPDSELNALWTRYYGMSFADFVRLVSTIR